MPGYEMSLILRTMSRPQTVEAIKRATGEIAKHGGIIRSLENVGERRLPYVMNRHGKSNKVGNYFVINFDSPNQAIPEVKNALYEDLDVVRRAVLRREVELGRPCHERACHFGELTDETRRQLINDERKYIKKL